MKTITLSALAAALLVAAAGTVATAAQKDYGPRGELVYDIVKTWGPHVQEAYRMDPRRWAQNMRSAFAKADMAALQRAADARTFHAMNSALLGPAASKKSSGISPKSLGDVAEDLVLVPIAPCRIIDTRVAGGAIAANTTRDFDVSVTGSYSFQGGEANDCNGAGSAGSYAAAVINFTVVTPTAAGYVTAFPLGTTQPLAATVNYTAGDIRGNLAVVKLDQGASANELSVYTFAQTHLVADIVGYFINPEPTALSCVDTAKTIVNTAAGATANVVAPACAAGYTATATNCEAGSWDAPFVYQGNGICSARNNGGSATDIRAYRTCCRVPGR